MTYFLFVVRINELQIVSLVMLNTMKIEKHTFHHSRERYL